MHPVRILLTRRSDNPVLVEEVRQLLLTATGEEATTGVAFYHVDDGSFLGGEIEHCVRAKEVIILIVAEGVVIDDEIDFVCALHAIQRWGSGKLFLIYASQVSSHPWRAIRDTVHARSPQLINLALTSDDAWQKTLMNWLLYHRPPRPAP